MQQLFLRVEHGDEKHRQWLKDQLMSFAADVDRGFVAPRFDPVADVQEFQAKFGLSYDGKPRFLPAGLDRFRRQFLEEEVQEYVGAVHEGGHLVASSSRGVRGDQAIVHELAEALDALVDTVYVAVGNSCFHGFDFREAWRRVHEKNMQKVRATSIDQTKRGNLHDVVKPPGWTPPDHTDLVTDHAHREIL